METQCAVQSRVVRGAKGSVRSGRGLVRGAMLCRRGHVLVALLWGGSPWCCLLLVMPSLAFGAVSGVGVLSLLARLFSAR